MASWAPKDTVASWPWISAIFRPGFSSFRSCTDISRAASSCRTVSTSNALWVPAAGYRVIQSPRKRLLQGSTLRVQAIPEEGEPRVGLAGDWATIERCRAWENQSRSARSEKFLYLSEARVALSPHLALPSAEIFTSTSLL